MNGIEGENFPVSKSFLCEAALAQVIERAYGFTNVQCRLIQATMRDVYKVTSNSGTHVLFIYRHHQRTAEQIEAEWNFIEYLHNCKVPVAPAIRQLNEQLLLTIPAPEGVRFAVLATFVAGEHLRKCYSADAVRLYGRDVAQLHRHSDAMPPELAMQMQSRPINDFSLVVARSLAAVAATVTHRPEDVLYLQGVAELLRPLFEALPREQPFFGMIHGDVIRANAQVDATGSVTLMDFDLCGPGWRAYDIASFLEVIRYTPVQAEAETAFLCGYQEVRPLLREEVAVLPLFGVARHFLVLGVPCMNAYHWGSVTLSDAAIDVALAGIRHNMKLIEDQATLSQ